MVNLPERVGGTLPNKVQESSTPLFKATLQSDGQLQATPITGTGHTPLRWLSLASGWRFGWGLTRDEVREAGRGVHSCEYLHHETLAAFSNSFTGRVVDYLSFLHGFLWRERERDRERERQRETERERWTTCTEHRQVENPSYLVSWDSSLP